MTETTQDLVAIKAQIEMQTRDTEILKTLLITTFKGLQPEVAKRAMLEGMMRGFQFKDFLEKNIYAVPFSGGYSLVTSIDYCRKIGMRSGIVGKSAPTYQEKDGKIIDCTVTVKRKVNDYIGDFTATVYFNEFNTAKNQWLTKPRVMIAKVAEMHALRMACPEEMSQAYIEEEFQKEKQVEVKTINSEEFKIKFDACKTQEELKTVWASLPAEVKKEYKELKEELKKKLAPKV